MVRYCTHCGNELNENAVVCVKCGCAIPKTSTYSSQGGYTPFASASIVDTITQRIKTNCPNCGAETNENAVVCVKCGCAIPKTSTYSSQGGYTPFASASIVDTITQRIKTNGIIWIVIAGIQILMGISFNWILLIVGVLNLISSIQDLNYSKEFPNNPVGIVEKMKPLGGAIVVLIYNLVIGGIIGVAGSIYYLIAVRGYVLENEQAFLNIENQCSSV